MFAWLLHQPDTCAKPVGGRGGATPGEGRLTYCSLKKKNSANNRTTISSCSVSGNPEV